MKRLTIGVIGNPNCGKTTLFNALTGAKQRVGNWPGVTVDRKTGSYSFEGITIEVIDTPGIYSLSAASLDEQVARDFVLSGEADLIVNIVDASNLERNLYLTVQLIEMKIPMLVALNMMDVARERGLKIDLERLSKGLGCPVVPVIATRPSGIEGLKKQINLTGTKAAIPESEVIMPHEVKEAVKALMPEVEDAARKAGVRPEWLSIKLLENDSEAEQVVEPHILESVRKQQGCIERATGEDSDIIIATGRYGFISELAADTVTRLYQASESLSDRIDRVVLNRILGIPVFLFAMYLMFMFTINIGGVFIDFFDQFAGAIFVDGTTVLLQGTGAPGWLVTLLANGVGGGIQTLATFIPPIGFMFLALSFLEDSGYMARAAFVMDRFMRFIGLPGKSFIPMLVGFGCNVPAIMATRTLESPRDRILTIMMNPFMSCGARLPVYALFAAAFFPESGQNLVFLLYLIGIGFAVITGLILKNTILKGEITPFVMELPPYHMPTVKSVLIRAYDRLQTFLFRAGQVLIPVVVVLAFLNSLGTDGSFGNEDSPNSVLASISRELTPMFTPMGITEENWPATVGLFTGIFAKEAVVGTLDSLYSSMDRRTAGKDEAEEPFSLLAAMGDAFATIPASLKELTGTFTDPMGVFIGDVRANDASAQDMEISKNTFGSMVTLFGSTAAAFSYLLFVLLYFPCSAAIAAVYHETSLGWTLFAGFWTTFMAWIAATCFYQIATFSAHPAWSLTWIIADAVMVMTVMTILYFAGTKRVVSNSDLLAGMSAK